ncbi:MAG: hypothetical protein Q8P45_01295 [Candidatus Harrisonbacteria bacterium]|nr:hypothetical protein [Candidatus Harrisonbacteria bacterium]
MRSFIVTASDPGGFNSIIPVARALLQHSNTLTLILGGPARLMAQKEGLKYLDGEILSPEELESFFLRAKPNALIAGTSGESTVDKRLILIAKQHGVPSLCILDSWLNYWQRFSSSDEKDFKYIPDIICAPDELAKEEMIADSIPAQLIRITGNPHFDHFTDAIRSDGEVSGRVLFVSQPFSELREIGVYTDYGYDEYAVLQDIIYTLAIEDISSQLLIHLHPREKRDKYRAFLSKAVCLSQKESLEEELSAAELIIGMNSTVLFQAAMAGKKVLSYQPHLKASDTLISNRLGLTELIQDRAALAKKIHETLNGGGGRNKQRVYPQDATEKVLGVINKIV